MTVWEYRNSLDLERLYKSGTICWTVVRNQEIYNKFNALVMVYADRNQAIKRMPSYGIHQRMIYYIIKELERVI